MTWAHSSALPAAPTTVMGTQSKAGLGWGEGDTGLEQRPFSVMSSVILNPAPAKAWPWKTGSTRDAGGTDPVRLPPTEERGTALLLGDRTARSLWEKQFNCLARLMRKIQR